MTKGELIYAIISAVNGGESSPEVPVRNFDVEAVLPTIISTAERLIEIEDVRSYRFSETTGPVDPGCGNPPHYGDHHLVRGHSL